MQTNPLVSVIMNCYNSDKFLKEAIESVLNQTYKNFEIIFWDNQSTDNSAKIVQSYDDKRIKYFYAPHFTPLGKARNLAIEKCTGEWIAFLDCDDIYDKDKLKLSFEDLLKKQNKNKIALIYSNSFFIDSFGNIKGKTKKNISGNIYFELLYNGNFIVFSSIIINKNILISIGNINEDLNYCEDYDLLLKITRNYDVIAVEEILTFYREHSKNITNTKQLANISETLDLLNSISRFNYYGSYTRIKILINQSYFLFRNLNNLRKELSVINLIKFLIKYKVLILIIPITLLIKSIFLLINRNNFK